MQFLTEYRINQAKFILANEKLPMAEVAEKAGFASVKNVPSRVQRDRRTIPIAVSETIK